MSLTLLYFGRPRERLGASREELQLDGITTLGELLTGLRARGENWTNELSEGRVRCAINQEFASPDAPLKDGDEVAIFSPISGG